jgi:hypothetical protein
VRKNQQLSDSMAAINDFTIKINEGWEKIRINAISKIENYLSTGNAEVMFSKRNGWSITRK